MITGSCPFGQTSLGNTTCGIGSHFPMYVQYRNCRIFPCTHWPINCLQKHLLLPHPHVSSRPRSCASCHRPSSCSFCVWGLQSPTVVNANCFMLQFEYSRFQIGHSDSAAGALEGTTGPQPSLCVCVCVCVCFEGEEVIVSYASQGLLVYYDFSKYQQLVLLMSVAFSIQQDSLWYSLLWPFHMPRWLDIFVLPQNSLDENCKRRKRSNCWICSTKIIKSDEYNFKDSQLVALQSQCKFFPEFISEIGYF